MTEYRARTLTLRLTGGATLLATVLGVYCVSNPAQAHEWRVCAFPAGCNYSGGPVTPLATQSVGWLGGSALDIGRYATFVICLGTLVAIATLMCARSRTGSGWRVVLCGAALLLAGCLVVFRLPQPEALMSFVGPCPGMTSCPTTVVPYASAIQTVWYLVPAAALGLLSAGLGILPTRSALREAVGASG